MLRSEIALHRAQNVVMERVADRGFKPAKKPARIIGTCVARCQRHSRAILRKLTKCVLASEQSYPAKSEILFDDLEGIVVPTNYASHSLDQVSVHIATFHFAANFGLVSLSPNWSRKEAA